MGDRAVYVVVPFLALKQLDALVVWRRLVVGWLGAASSLHDNGATERTNEAKKGAAADGRWTPPSRPVDPASFSIHISLAPCIVRPVYRVAS